MTTKNYGAIQDVEGLRAYMGKVITEGKAFGFDIETGYDGPNGVGFSTLPFHPNFKLVGFSFTNSTEWGRYVPIAHDNGQNAPEVAAARLLWSMLQTGMGVAHNAMFELQGLSKWFRKVLWDDTFFAQAVRSSHGYFPVLSDSMIEANMMQCYQPLGAGGGVGVGLKGLALHVFGHKMTEFKDLFPEEDTEMGPGTPKKDLKYIRFNTREISPKVIEYACEDSVWCLALHEKHYPEVEGRLMFRTEILLLNVCAEMELAGLELDWLEYERRSVEVGDFLAQMNEEIQEYFSERLGELVSVNLGSPKQVAELLYDKLGLPEQINSKTKNRTTDEKAITTLERQDAGVRRIARWREVSKLQSSYITKYLKDLHYAEDGRAHPNHNQLGAGTGRFSVDHVSYQQWPKPYHLSLDSGRTLDLNYRNFLVAPEGFRIVGFDFSQVELRILAGMTQETAMLKAFADGVDIHKATASTMLKIPLEDITKADRAKGKTLNFGIVYGLGADALAETLGITIEEANALLEQYYEGFPKLRSWMDERVLEGSNHWEVSTLFGRRFHIWEYDEHERLMRKAQRMPTETKEQVEERKKVERWARRMRSKADRMCVNAPVQGGAADYLKLGMVRVNRKIKEMGWEGKVILVMTIHDALEFYVHESISTQEVIDTLNPCVSFPVEGLPEIKADWHEGLRWGYVVELELDKNKQIAGYAWEDEDYEKHEFATLEEAYAFQKQYVYGGHVSAEASKPEPAEKKHDAHYVIYFADLPGADEWAKAKELLDQCASETGLPLLVEIDGERKYLPGLFSITSTPSDMLRGILSTGALELEAIEA